MVAQCQIKIVQSRYNVKFSKNYKINHFLERKIYAYEIDLQD